MTLLPALLVICGRWVFWPVRPTLGSAEPSATGFWARVGAPIKPRPRAVWLGTCAALLVASIGMFGLNAKGLTAAESFRGTPESIEGDAVATAHFPAAAGNPVHVLTSADTADEVAAAVAAADGIATVAEPQVIGDTALIEAELADAADSQAAYATVEELRIDARRRRGRRGAGRRQHRPEPRRPDRLAARQPGDHPADHARGAGRARRPAAGDRRARSSSSRRWCCPTARRSGSAR